MASVADPAAFAVDFLVGDFLATGFFAAEVPRPAFFFDDFFPEGVLAATTSFSVVFLAVVFFVVPDLDFAVFEAVSAFLAPSSPDVRSEGVVLPEGCFPEGSPPPRRVFFVAIPRV